jgi:hypothetical protein
MNVCWTPHGMVAIELAETGSPELKLVDGLV